MIIPENLGKIKVGPGGLIYFKEETMACPALTPLAPQALLGDRYEMPEGQEFKSFKLDPIDEAVRAVEEAQDAVGKSLWQ